MVSECRNSRAEITALVPCALQFLRVMYEGSTEFSALMNVVPAIERFLESQSTLLQRKLDVLAAYRANKLGGQLHDQNSRLDKDKLAQAIAMASSYWEAQLEHRWREFQVLADQHLPTVGIANGFLRQLYASAWTHKNGLSRSTTGIASTSIPDTFSPMSRKWRRFSGPMASGSSRMGSVDNSRGSRPTDITHVQLQLELSNQLVDISKRVELWNSLALAISSAAVVSAEEIAHAIEK